MTLRFRSFKGPELRRKGKVITAVGVFWILVSFGNFGKKGMQRVQKFEEGARLSRAGEKYAIAHITKFFDFVISCKLFLLLRSR